ncbi:MULTISPECIES: DUF3611 family protein [Fischerella]|uniref:DUF3611 family protein n=1 Tax=Fischerella TaxID=1190 RepID=UPI0002F03139|nr:MULTISPECIES: DUF3611 family protein [Fischerella]MBD2430854.1 DUF3611 family protein [Fischerella sp. FACHB-380]
MHTSHSPSTNVHRIASEFRILGWIGFWLQLVLGSIPLFIAIPTLLFRSNPGRVGTQNSIGVFFAYACLLVLIFTIYWCFRYTRLSKKLDDPDLRPSRKEVTRDLWIGILANISGMIFAVIVLLTQVGLLLNRVLSIPQGAATIYTPLPGAAIATSNLPITPLQIISMQAVSCAIAAELVGVIVALWLLYRLIPQPAYE